MRVMGIDPGTQIAGYGVVEDSGSRLVHIDNGCITSKRGTPLPQRLSDIYAGLVKALREFSPDVVAIEEVFFSKSISTTLRLGESRGVAILAGVQNGVEVVEYSTREVKQSITGFGQASKEQVQKMIQNMLKLPQVAQVDASDALALAICHLNSYKLKKALTK